MEQRRGPGRPKKVEGEYDKTRSLRLGEVWDRALAIATWRGDKLNAIVGRALQMYVDLHEREFQAAHPPTNEADCKES